MASSEISESSFACAHLHDAVYKKCESVFHRKRTCFDAADVLEFELPLLGRHDSDRSAGQVLAIPGLAADVPGRILGLDLGPLRIERAAPHPLAS